MLTINHSLCMIVNWTIQWLWFDQILKLCTKVLYVHCVVWTVQCTLACYVLFIPLYVLDGCNKPVVRLDLHIKQVHSQTNKVSKDKVKIIFWSLKRELTKAILTFFLSFLTRQPACLKGKIVIERNLKSFYIYNSILSLLFKKKSLQIICS